MPRRKRGGEQTPFFGEHGDRRRHLSYRTKKRRKKEKKGGSGKAKGTGGAQRLRRGKI